MALQPFWTLAAFIGFLIYTQSVGLLGREIRPSQGRYLHVEQHKQNKRTQTSMPRVGFKTTIPVFEGAKTVHALGHAATVIGNQLELLSVTRVILLPSHVLNVQAELDCNVMVHGQKTILHVWGKGASPCCLTADMRGRHFSSLLAASFCVGVAPNGLTHPAVLFHRHFPSFTQVCAIT
jgi:hypothetical protein